MTWIFSCVGLHSQFALRLHPENGVSVSPQKFFVFSNLCWGIYVPQGAAWVRRFLQQDGVKKFLYNIYFHYYPESKDLVSKSPLCLKGGSYFVFSQWEVGF